MSFFVSFSSFYFKVYFAKVLLLQLFSISIFIEYILPNPQFQFVWVQCGSLLYSIYTGLIFVSAQPVDVFQLVHLVYTFRVIISMHVSIIIFLNVFVSVFVGLLLLLYYPPREVPLAFVVKLTSSAEFIQLLLICNFFFLISPLNLNESFPGYNFLGCKFYSFFI